jgi:hypothetical protein
VSYRDGSASIGKAAGVDEKSKVKNAGKMPSENSGQAGATIVNQLGV